jgi:hypothetical protein
VVQHRPSDSKVKRCRRRPLALVCACPAVSSLPRPCIDRFNKPIPTAKSSWRVIFARSSDRCFPARLTWSSCESWVNVERRRYERLHSSPHAHIRELNLPLGPLVFGDAFVLADEKGLVRQETIIAQTGRKISRNLGRLLLLDWVRVNLWRAEADALESRFRSEAGC